MAHAEIGSRNAVRGYRVDGPLVRVEVRVRFRVRVTYEKSGIVPSPIINIAGKGRQLREMI